jgi:amino acid transporter
MPGGGHRFYFVGKVPLPFSVLLCFLFLNTFLMLFLPKATVGALSWYEDNSIKIQLVILALMAVVVVIFRKHIRWESRRPIRWDDER